MINFSGRFRGAGAGALAIAAAIAVGCGAATVPEGDRPVAIEGRLWVLAPHPDDEVLIASELLRAAVHRHRPHTVLVMTNGDLSCDRDGHARQRETLAALAELGVLERDVRFLGYPDGWLDALGPEPFGPVPRRSADGSCGVGDHTYASHGVGGVDLHTARTGAPGAYVASGPVDDLAWLLARERPTEIVTTHGIDTHPDHAMTYAYLRRAIERTGIATRVLRAVVHQGPCWPNGNGLPPCPDVRLTQGTPFPSFAPPLDRYAPGLRITSADGGVLARAAIAHYTTQLGSPNAEESWLSAFARTDEIFWPELDAPPARTASVDASFAAGATLALDDVTLVIDASGATLRDEGVLRSLPVPHGDDTTTSHAWQLALTRVGNGNAPAEISVRRDGELWMQAVIGD
jgi:LmbE family N-acetylglucosaminyl deacetylase